MTWGRRTERTPVSTETPKGSRLGTALLHLYVLAGLAIAQPLYDLLKDGGALFIADGARPVDIWLVVATLSFVVPSILAIVEVLVSAASARGGRVVHGLFVVALSALVVSAPLGRHSQLATPLHVAACLLAGAAVTLAYFRVAGIRSFFTVLTPASLLFPVLFVTSSAMSGLLWPGRAADESAVDTARGVPIVLVVFDEMSSLHLLGRDGQIDAARFPGFARLARTTTWYRNARTVADGTIQALPAILTGTMTDPDWKMPAYRYFPHNLFTLLRRTHHMNVHETVTRLCPTDLCPPQAESMPSRLSALGEDLAIVYLHLIAPAGWRAELPEISQGWAGFADPQGDWQGGAGWLRAAGDQAYSDRSVVFHDFLQRVKDVPTSSLSFLHILLPHIPLVYSPSGATYGSHPIRNLKDEKWGDDEWAVVQAEQRYLLQLQFVDELVSELLDTLEARHLLDDSLLIVTADHGVSFVPGDMRRGLGAANRPEIARIPLFVKVPGQQHFGVSDIDARLVDILPTIGAVVGSRPSWPMAGRSLLDEGRPERESTGKLFCWRARGYQEVAPVDVRAFVEHHADVYGEGSDPLSLYRVGPAGEIVGTPVSELEVAGPSELRVDVDQEDALADVKPSTGFLPVFLTGTVHGGDDTRARDLAVALDGTIAATTRTYRKSGRTRFSAAVPEQLLRSGANTVEVFELVPDPAGALRLLRCAGRVRARLVADGSAAERVVLSTGEEIPVRERKLEGYLDAVRRDGRRVHIHGWAFDLEADRPADRILVLVGDELVAIGSTGVERDDVEAATGRNAARSAGFDFSAPVSRLRRSHGALRVLAVSHEGVATDLVLGDGTRQGLSACLSE